MFLNPSLTFYFKMFNLPKSKKATQMLLVTRHLIIVIRSVKYLFNPASNDDFAAKSCWDLDLHGSDPNVAHGMSSHYGDQFYEIVENPTSNNEVMGRTRFFCKVML